MRFTAVVVCSSVPDAAGLQEFLQSARIRTRVTPLSGSIENAIENAPRELVIVDVIRPMNFEFVRAIRKRSANSPILAWGGESKESDRVFALCWNAHYASRDAPRDDQIAAALRALKRETPDRPDWLRGKGARHHLVAGDPQLTRREVQVLGCLGYGLSNDEIARLLCVAVETVKEHVQNCLRKLDMSSRTSAAVWAVKHGLC